MKRDNDHGVKEFDGVKRTAVGVFAFIATSASLLAALAGCADNNSGGQPQVAPGPAIVQNQCQVGQIYNAQYGCLNQYSCQNGYGWVPQQGICVPGTVTTSTTSGNKFSAPLSITSQDTFTLALQTARLCDPYLVGWNGGSASCKNYSKAGYVDFQVSTSDATKAYIVIGAGSSNPNGFNSDWTTGGRVLKMEGNVNLFAYNNNQGFIATNGSSGGVRLVVTTGLPGSANSLPFTLEYNGIEFARGTLTRY